MSLISIFYGILAHLWVWWVIRFLYQVLKQLSLIAHLTKSNMFPPEHLSKTPIFGISPLEGKESTQADEILNLGTCRLNPHYQHHQLPPYPHYQHQILVPAKIIIAVKCQLEVIIIP